MAKEWKQLLAIPLPKKVNIKQCQNHRTTSLISQPSKMVLWVTFNWLKTRAEDLLEEEQAGLTELRLGRSTAEQIILAIMEKHLSSTLIYSLTTRVVGAPQIISKHVSSIFPCSLLPSGTWRTPDLSIPRCFLPTSFSVCLVSFPISLSLANWIWQNLMNGRYDHTTAVFVSLRRSGGLRLIRLPAGSWHGLPRW